MKDRYTYTQELAREERDPRALAPKRYVRDTLEILYARYLSIYTMARVVLTFR